MRWLPPVATCPLWGGDAAIPRAIIGGGVGRGLMFKSERAGEIDLMVISSCGLWRMAGLLALGNATENVAGIARTGPPRCPA